MAQYLDKSGVTTLWGKVLELDSENKDLHITKVVVGEDSITPTPDETAEYGQKIDLSDIITPMQDQIADLANTLYANYTNVSLSASGGPIEIGVAKTITVTVKCTYNGAAEEISSLELRRTGSSGEILSSDVGTGGVLTYSDQNQSAATSYWVKVTTVKGVVKTATASVQAYHPSYFFASASEIPTSEELLAISGSNKRLMATGTFNLAIQIESGQRMWMCVPQPRTVTNVTNGPSPLWPGFAPAVTVEVDGKTTYNCYGEINTNAGSSNSTYTITVA